MRTRTFIVSLVVHALLIGTAIVVPIFATDVLPLPFRSTKFVTVNAEMPDVEVPRARPQASSSSAPTAVSRVPVVEPAGVTNEMPATDFDRPTADLPLSGFGGDPSGTRDGIAPPPAPVITADQSAPPAPIRVGGGIRPPQKVQHVAPDYPAIARSARVSGTVILEAVIAEDGTVRDVRVLRSIRLLDDAAIEAVRQWRFTPTLLNGEAVPVIMTVTVAFNLN
jgi:periplasmic protein TonB